ncbi:MAG TPA: DUF1732 domain-containing protein [Bacteroidales bacterium]|nr:DUF1732 domain-containing protein [Bacteroidales bacterium]HRZ21099.1 DUF1732 domain-containing protein [Bacteroidales bacterium]
MIKSMTGYGKEDMEFNARIVHVEIRTLNSKQTDISIRSPGRYREKELEIRSLLTDRLARGKIDMSIMIDNNSDENHYSVNRSVAIRYLNELRELAHEIGEDDFRLYLPLLTRLPEVFSPQREAMITEEWEVIRSAAERAIDATDQFRIQEGAILQADMEKRIQLILAYLGEITPFEENRIGQIRERLQKNLTDMMDDTRIDTNRFEQELLYYLDKLDISEEKVRLRKHCDYFLETMKEESSNGKKLTFISQEIGREINTLGAKANEVNIQRRVVQMKDELEKIKEQLSNVL